MGQMAIGLLNEQNITSAQEPLTEAGEELDTVDIGKQLERVRWFLWHGNVVRALDTIEDIEDELDLLPQNSESRKKLLKAVREFRGYIEANQNFMPNYGDRYRHGEKISTGFAESAVNQVVSKRMVKKQQMRWTEPGAHNLLQVRTKVLNDQLRETFVRWYPEMQTEQETQIQKKVHHIDIKRLLLDGCESVGNRLACLDLVLLFGEHPMKDSTDFNVVVNH